MPEERPYRKSKEISSENRAERRSKSRTNATSSGSSSVHEGNMEYGRIIDVNTPIESGETGIRAGSDLPKDKDTKIGNKALLQGKRNRRSDIVRRDVADVKVGQSLSGGGRRMRREEMMANVRKGIISKIQLFISLMDRWDGYSAIPVQVDASTNAIMFVYQMPYLVASRLQDVYPTQNGTVGFMWKNDKEERVSLEIGDDSYSYYAKYTDKSPIFGKGNKLKKSVSRLRLFQQIAKLY